LRASGEIAGQCISTWASDKKTLQLMFKYFNMHILKYGM
jgi:hypothetical protein